MALSMELNVHAESDITDNVPNFLLLANSSVPNHFFKIELPQTLTYYYTSEYCVIYLEFPLVFDAADTQVNAITSNVWSYFDGTGHVIMLPRDQPRFVSFRLGALVNGRAILNGGSQVMSAWNILMNVGLAWYDKCIPTQCSWL